MGEIKNKLKTLMPELMTELREIQKKGGDITDAKLELETLKLLKSEIQKVETLPKDQQPKEDVEIYVLNSLVKSHVKAIDAFKASGRKDLAGKEQKELEILNSFLPKLPSDQEIKAKVDEWKKTNGLSEIKGPDIGKAMKHFKSLYPNIDGKKLNQILQL